ncbi:MAG: 2-haloalkanoic acid dehalogenase [Candidatus Nomurabacteria bacterium]|nr:2-haloalkanoic acid dehalogenase [Candidatus Nomurabacteria bacterium]
MNKYKLIIFDLIDTLADCKGLSEMTAQLESTLGQEAIDMFIDKGNIDKIKSIDEAINIFRSKKDFSEENEKLLRQWVGWSNTILYEDTIETLKYLKDKGYEVAIISNTPPTSKDQLAELGINQYIDVAIFSFEVGSRKPEKEIFLSCLEKTGVDPSEALMIGDSIKNDINGAKNVGIDALLIDRNNIIDYEPKITNLNQLQDIL